MKKNILILILVGIVGLFSTLFAESLQTFEASSVEELVQCIGSNRVIYLTADAYDLSDWESLAKKYHNPGIGRPELPMHEGQQVYPSFWACRFNDAGLFRVENLTLIGKAEKGRPEIFVTERLSDVLSIRECKNITLRNLEFGHRVEPGHCDGSVLQLEFSEGVFIENCDLYGCGTYGLDTMASFNVKVVDSLIHDCTYGIVFCWASGDLEFTDSKIDRCDGSMKFYGCNRVLVDGCRFEDVYDSAYPDLAFYDGSLSMLEEHGVLFFDSEGLKQRLHLDELDLRWEDNDQISSSTGNVTGPWKIIDPETDVSAVLEISLEELTDRLGDKSNAGYGIARALKADAMKLKTQWKIGKLSMLRLEFIEQWRNEFQVFRNRVLEHGSWFGGGGSAWGHAMASEAVVSEEFIAEWAVELSDLETSTTRITVEGKQIEDIWHVEIQQLYDEVGYVDEEDGRPFLDSAHLKRACGLPSWNLALLYQRLKSERAKRAVVAFLRNEAWTKKDIRERQEPSNDSSENVVDSDHIKEPELYGIIHRVGYSNEESLESIAEKYDSKPEWILQANDDPFGFELRMGREIFVPVNR